MKTPFEQGVAARRKDGDGDTKNPTENPYTSNLVARWDWYQGYSAEDYKIRTEGKANV